MEGGDGDEERWRSMGFMRACAAIDVMTASSSDATNGNPDSSTCFLPHVRPDLQPTQLSKHKPSPPLLPKPCLSNDLNSIRMAGLCRA